MSINNIIQTNKIKITIFLKEIFKRKFTTMEGNLNKWINLVHRW